MKMFMPATKERPSLLVPCRFCPVLHIPLNQASSGETIFCPNANDKPLPHGYYSDLLQGRLSDATVGKSTESYHYLIAYIIITGIQKKLSVFTDYYENLT